MELETLYVTTRAEWRKWLSQHFSNKHEIWLIYPHKSSGKPVIEYNTAVEEALCFGWIDSLRKSFDDDHSIQKFSVRKERSGYSQLNRERLKRLLKRDMIHSSIIDKVKEVLKEEFIFPQDILDQLKADEEVWQNYQEFSGPYKRIRIAYIETARKREEIFQQRLNNFIKHTKANKLVKGFGGTDKYY